MNGGMKTTGAIANKGRYGDNKIGVINDDIAHLNSWEKYISENHSEIGEALVEEWGSGTINPKTGLKEYNYGGTEVVAGNQNWQTSPHYSYDEDGNLIETMPEGMTTAGMEQAYSTLTDATELMQEQWHFLFGGQESWGGASKGYLSDVYQLSKLKSDIERDTISVGYDKIDQQDLSNIHARDYKLEALDLKGEATEAARDKSLAKIGTTGRKAISGLGYKEDLLQSKTGFATSSTGAFNQERKDTLADIKAGVVDVGKTSQRELKGIDATKRQAEIEYADKAAALGFDRDLLSIKEEKLDVTDYEDWMSYQKSVADARSGMQMEMNQIISQYEGLTGIDIGDMTHDRFNTSAWSHYQAPNPNINLDLYDEQT